MNSSILQIKLTQLLFPYECFFSKLKDHNPLEKEFIGFTKLLNSGLSQQEALKKLRLKVVPLSGVDNYNYLKVIWEEEQKSTFRDFVEWYNNKGVVPTLEAMQKMIEFYHNKGIDILKLGCKLPHLAKICLLMSTNHKFFPFVESYRDAHDKIREDMTGGPSIVFTRKAVVDQTYIRNSENICKSIVGIDASQLYPFQCVKKCQQGSTHDRSSTQILKNSNLEPINLEHLRTWSCLISNHNAQNAQLKAIIQP